MLTFDFKSEVFICLLLSINISFHSFLAFYLFQILAAVSASTLSLTYSAYGTAAAQIIKELTDKNSTESHLHMTLSESSWIRKLNELISMENTMVRTF